MERVLVLLSTYNGEKYIRQQMDSILMQTYPYIDILVRDDGSTDNTINILIEYSNKYPNISYYEGENIGTCNSFFDLMTNAGRHYDFYAFADQDDYWLPIKVSKAIEAFLIDGARQPILYCSNVTLVNEELEEIPSVVRQGTIKASFGNALIEDISTGCTCIMNAKLFSLIKENLPQYAIMHDWWFYLVATCFGQVYYDNQSYILYRQHHLNVIGVPTNYFNLYLRRLKNLKSTKGTIRKQVEELTNRYEITGENKQLVDSIMKSKRSVFARISILFNKKIFRQSFTDNVIFKLLIVIRGC